jgi:hypothetical protein
LLEKWCFLMSLIVLLVTGVALALAPAVPAVIAILRARRKDIPAVVRAIGGWWWK